MTRRTCYVCGVEWGEPCGAWREGQRPECPQGTSYPPDATSVRTLAGELYPAREDEFAGSDDEAPPCRHEWACCGVPVVGAQYGGMSESLCCARPVCTRCGVQQ